MRLYARCTKLYCMKKVIDFLSRFGFVILMGLGLIALFVMIKMA